MNEETTVQAAMREQETAIASVLTRGRLLANTGRVSSRFEVVVGAVGENTSKPDGAATGGVKAARDILAVDTSGL